MYDYILMTEISVYLITIKLMYFLTGLIQTIYNYSPVNIYTYYVYFIVYD